MRFFKRTGIREKLRSARLAVPVKGVIDGHGAVIESDSASTRVVPAPEADDGPNLIALMATTGAWAGTVGWFFYYRPSTKIEGQAYGRVCIVIDTSNKSWLRVVVRSLGDTVMVVHPLGAESDVEEIELLSATPILWIRAIDAVR